MTTATTPDAREARPLHWIVLVSTAVVVCLFLFFIDEGNYSLKGLEKTGNIVAMSLYFVGILIGLFAMNTLLSRMTPSAGRTALVLGIGSILGTALTILFIYVMAGFTLPT